MILAFRDGAQGPGCIYQTLCLKQASAIFSYRVFDDATARLESRLTSYLRDRRLFIMCGAFTAASVQLYVCHIYSLVITLYQGPLSLRQHQTLYPQGVTWVSHSRVRWQPLPWHAGNWQANSRWLPSHSSHMRILGRGSVFENLCCVLTGKSSFCLSVSFSFCFLSKLFCFSFCLQS